MKTALFFLLFLFIGYNGKAQVYSPQLAGYNGYSTIYYPFGYYQGNVINGIANGTGVFYYVDGSFYYGNFYGGFFDGPGVIANPIYGYVSGCFSQGVFVGTCQVFNPYETDSQVENIISEVQENRPDDADETVYTPKNIDEYKIIRIDSDSEVGGYITSSARN